MTDDSYLLTAAEADRRATGAAIRLARRGLATGDRIAVLAPAPGVDPGSAAASQAAVVCLAMAALRLGVVPVMVNPVLAAQERAGFISDARVSAVVPDGPELLALTSPEWVDGYEVELSSVPLGRPMHFTSGTTGRSKGVWSGILNEREAAQYWADEAAQWTITPTDVVLNHGPLAHSAPLRFSMLAMLHGASVIYTGAFDTDRISNALYRHRPTVAMAVPTHLQRLLTQPGGPPASNYRLLVHAGSSCPPDLKRAVHDWAGVDNVWEFLGSTEGQFTACRGSEWEERPGTLGRARHGRSLTIEDGSSPGEGMIWCQAPEYAQFSYFDDDAKTAAAWRSGPFGTSFTVGDLGRLDDDGYLYLRGRRHDLIISGGVNVYPAEVEAELRECPEVRDVAVFGEPDDRWGDRVCAAVVGDTTSNRVSAWAREHIAGYRRPKRITIVSELPLTSNGKVLRDGLDKWVAENVASLHSDRLDET